MRKKKPIDYLFPKVRQAVFTAVVLQPSKIWNFSDLARHLKLTPSSLQRELAGLETAGIIAIRRFGGRVYVQADSTCSFLEEIQGLMRKSRLLIDMLVEALEPFASSIDAAYVFGPMAKSAQSSNRSDLEILIIGSAKMRDLEPTMGVLERTLKRPVNSSHYTRADFFDKLSRGNPFLRSLQQEERTLIVGAKDVFNVK